MQGEMSVQRRMETIQSIFREVQDNFQETWAAEDISVKLDTYDSEFRSIAYEAAAFCLALSDLDKGFDLVSWKPFQNTFSVLHNTQIHIGLGWALAQKQVSPSRYLPELEPMMRYRVLDGYGYYEGIFRARKSIWSQQEIETNDEIARGAFNQGLGRSLWYLNKGNVAETVIMLEKFSNQRKRDLWRGLGIALTYVGGLHQTELKSLLDKAGEYKPQLIAGSVMAFYSRKQSKCHSKETELCCEFLSGKSIGELDMQVTSILKNLNKTSDSCFSEWLMQLEQL